MARKDKYQCPLKRFIRVIDGDTPIVEVDRGWRDSKEIYLRLADINCPETRGESDLHEKAGRLVGEVVEKWITTSEDVQVLSHDLMAKYEGRSVGDMLRYVDDAPDSRLTMFLMGYGLAKEYPNGEGPKPTWTDEELHQMIDVCHQLLARDVL